MIMWFGSNSHTILAVAEVRENLMGNYFVGKVCHFFKCVNAVCQCSLL